MLEVVKARAAGLDTRQLTVKSARYVELDSLRGLAALIVVLHHLLNLWQADAEPASATIRSLLGLVYPFGTEAVILFFVLSGFVLSLPAINGKPQTYSTFLIRRIFRIYVPYLAALLVSVAGAFWLHGIVTRSIWFHQFWSEPVNWSLVGQHVLFLSLSNTDQFDPPIWSLVYEMRISLIFPLLCGTVLQLKSRWSLVIAGGLTLIPIVFERLVYHLDGSAFDSPHFAGLFVLGILLARERGRLGAWFRCRRRIARVLIGAASLWLFLFAGQLFVGATVHALDFQRSLLYISQWITALGAGGLMIVGLNSASCQRILFWRPIHFLGQVSYSLYLWHFVVLLYCVHLFYGKVSPWAILCLTFALTMIVSWFSYRWIEVPSMNLGRRLSNAFQPHPARDSRHKPKPAIPE